MVTFNKNAWSRVWLVVMVVLVLSAGLPVVSGCSTESAPNDTLAPAPIIGREAPDFTLEDLDGNSVRLNDLRGKVVFLNFWATWCPPCRAEMPDIETVYQEYKDQDIVFLGIDIQQEPGIVRDFIELGGYNWQMLLDKTGKVATSYNVRAIPTSYFVDKEGIISGVAVGGMTRSAIETKLTEALR